MAQTANEALLDALIRHQTYLLRYSGYVRNRILATLNATEQDIAEKIQARLANSKGLTSPVEVRRLEALISVISGIRNKAWEDSKAWLEEQAIALAYQEPIILQSILATVSPVVIETVMPASRLLKAVVLSQPFEGRVLREWADTMQQDDLRRISQAIRVGMIAGETTDTIVTRVIGTRAFNGTDGSTEVTRRQVQAITRTAIQHIANNAREEFLKENVDVIEAELFVATLDSRTTPVCRANDGKVFPVGSGPRCPLHYQCRSLRVAHFDGERLGLRPAKANTKKQLLREFAEKHNLGKLTSREDLPRGMKGPYDEFARKRIRELTGRVPASTSYQIWLERQSKQFQEDTLGLTKAKLFRDGGLKLDKFVAANGSELTLAELAAKHPSAFRAAGLEPDAFT